jgi:hypothetical protein
VGTTTLIKSCLIYINDYVNINVNNNINIQEGERMGKRSSIETAYQIATLTFPSEEVTELLCTLEFERALELLLIVRQTRGLKSPLNLLRRAIQENWTAEVMPEKVDRRMQNATERNYIRQGLKPEEAAKKAREPLKPMNEY